MDKWRKLHSHYLNNIKTNTHKVKPTQNTLHFYQWKLPRYQKQEIEILCVGFFRKDANKSQYIPKDVINILVYYTFENTLNIIKQNGTLESGIFEVNNCKFNLSSRPYCPSWEYYHEAGDEKEEDNHNSNQSLVERYASKLFRL